MILEDERTNGIWLHKAGLVTMGFAIAFMIALLALTGCANTSSSDSASASASDSESAEETDQEESVPVDPITVGEGKMAVYVTIQDTQASADAEGATDQRTGESTTLLLNEGATILDALDATGREVVTSGDGSALEIVSIGDLANGADGESSHWAVIVNGQTIESSFAEYPLANNDSVIFTFVKE